MHFSTIEKLNEVTMAAEEKAYIRNLQIYFGMMPIWCRARAALG